MTSPNPLDAIAAEMKAAAQRAQEMSDTHLVALRENRREWNQAIWHAHIAASNPTNALAVLEAYEKLKLELKTTHG